MDIFKQFLQGARSAPLRELAEVVAQVFCQGPLFVGREAIGIVSYSGNSLLRNRIHKAKEIENNSGMSSLNVSSGYALSSGLESPFWVPVTNLTPPAYIIGNIRQAHKNNVGFLLLLGVIKKALIPSAEIFFCS